MKGVIVNIQRFSVDDGPGIRTCVFFKGCPLRCAWCHNPESQDARPELRYDAPKCVGCGACMAACPNVVHALLDDTHVLMRDRCVRCFSCAEACCSGALSRCGESATVEDILATVLRDTAFYERSGGGVTLTGGEPMAQPAFALELAARAKKRGLHVCLETCGACSWEHLSQIAPFVDQFLYDFKLSDDDAHRVWTGVSNKGILENLTRLCDAGARVVLRCPIIPEVNLNEAHFDAIASLAKRCTSVEAIHLEPYHPLGIQKAETIGRRAYYDNRAFLTRETLAPFADDLRQRVPVPVLMNGG